MENEVSFLSQSSSMLKYFKLVKIVKCCFKSNFNIILHLSVVEDIL